MNTKCKQRELSFQGFGRRKVIVQNDAETTSSDGGLIILSAIEQRRRFIRRFASFFHDSRNVKIIQHPLESLLKQRIFGICQGYEDLNDHEDWRNDPVLALVCDKEPGKTFPAGKSTLNRLELGPVNGTESERYKRISWDDERIRIFFVNSFLESFSVAPETIILDFDSTDDPLHGEQESRFFNGYYDEYCYLPLYVFSGEHLLVADLRSADEDGATGALETLQFLVKHIRNKWPDVRIILRADSGFCRNDLMNWCEENNCFYVLGLPRNARLIRAIGSELNSVKLCCAATGQASRVFKELLYKTRSSWKKRRRVVAKAECLPRGVNPRFLATNVPDEEWDARALYEDLYCARGNMENRIKEQKLFLFADRTSCHPFRANQLRLWLSSVAYLFFVELRKVALAGTEWVTAQVNTIRIKLLKVAATVTTSFRRVLIHVPLSFPYWDDWLGMHKKLSF